MLTQLKESLKSFHPLHASVVELAEFAPEVPLLELEDESSPLPFVCVVFVPFVCVVVSASSLPLVHPASADKTIVPAAKRAAAFHKILFISSPNVFFSANLSQIHDSRRIPNTFPNPRTEATETSSWRRRSTRAVIFRKGASRASARCRGRP